ncbi:hypothetical protein TbgDal_IX3480 [Trypanosoma brucei gambiense DAL972]|uniref:Uncharacterized protein n=1 Tax=Trypanosoma brucei gambiense (strain MHOM/CI/86/DAL972) TaxID=679716 RepID=C9ZXX8_TRYB9|nr:hypothetical protein TbgDal_IX3480 [Trypanosoma brucei gambiense DAL972]CBH14273.1 hypothetical protein TbgDal_IX3480 [Trypanosoma brucei gambiense DAL972]|eukprot:XP_011776543.1 hypothetical protein TbgDal_IX3480 [Trypanosoma brucei gambiense DAL972]
MNVCVSLSLSCGQPHGGTARGRKKKRRGKEERNKTNRKENEMKEFLVPITALWVDSSLAIVLCTLFLKKKIFLSSFSSLFIRGYYCSSFHTYANKYIYIYIYIIPSFHFTKQFRDSICHQCELARTTFSFLKKKTNCRGTLCLFVPGYPFLFVNYAQICALLTPYKHYYYYYHAVIFSLVYKEEEAHVRGFFFNFFFVVVCLYLTSLSWMHASYRLGGHKTQGRK